MENKTNSAIRLANIIRKIRKSNHSRVLDTYTYVFNLEGDNEIDKTHKVIKIMYILQDQFSTFLEDMENKSFSKELYCQEVDNLKEILADPRIDLRVHSSNITRKISDVHLKVFDFCSEIIEQEDLLDSKDLEELNTLIDELEKFIENSDLDKNLKNVLESHLKSMKKVVVEYQIKGAEVFKGFFGDSMSTYMSNYPDFMNNEKVNIIFKKTIDGFAKAEKAVNKLNSFSTTCISFFEKGEKLISLAP